MYEDDYFTGIRTVLSKYAAARGLKTKDIAAGTGLTRQAVYRILNGRTRAPHRASVEKLVGYLNVPLDALLKAEITDPMPGFLVPDPEVVAQIPNVIGPELETLIEDELPGIVLLDQDTVGGESYRDFLKMGLYYILKRRKLSSPGSI